MVHLLPLFAPLAQFGLDEPALPDLAGPAPHERLLLENPWPLAGGLLLAGVVLAWALGRSAETRKKSWLGLAPLVLSVGVVVLAGLVETGRERLVSISRELVGAIVDPEPAVVEAALAEGARFTAGRLFEADKGELVAIVSAAQGGGYSAGGQTFVIERHTIRSVRAETSAGGRQGRTLVNVRVETGSRLPTAAWLELDFDLASPGRPGGGGESAGENRRGRDTWKVRSIRLLWTNATGNLER